MANEQQQRKLTSLEEESLRIDNELKAADLELKRHQLEALRRQNAEASAKEQAGREREANTKARNDKAQREREQLQEFCNHKQGGDGIEGLYQGDDNQYAIAIEGDSLGHVIFRCTRCDKKWEENDPEYKTVKLWPHKGFKAAVPVTFTVPGVNAPMPAGWKLDDRGNPQKIA